MFKKMFGLFIVLALLAGLIAGCGAATEEPEVVEPTAVVAEPTTAEEADLTLATTTSTADTGLLDYLVPQFEEVCDCNLDYIAVGTGQAIEMGANGDADVLLVHSRKSEDKFVADGNAKERFDVMYNDFVLVGPKEDPAKVSGMTSSVDALAAIAAAEATFASRGDKSGTNNKEISLWASAAITPTAEMAWYKSLGQGMGDTLLFSQESLAYTLSDRGTWLAMQDKLPDLAIVVGGPTLTENPDKKLLNPYGVMAVNPDTHPGVEYDLAMQFVEWILSDDVQAMIGDFGVEEFGQSLFYPGAPASTTPAPAAPVLKLTGPAQELAWTEEELKALGTIDVPYTGKDGTTTTYTGVLMSILLEAANCPADATLILVAGDGYTAEVAAADVATCADCIVAFDPEGGLRSVLPSQGGKAQVKGLVEIQISGGTPAEAPAGGIPEGAALKITGKVGQEIGWLEADVLAMETMDVQSTNKSGETETYTGVLMSKLLEMAAPAANATTLVFVADDGYTAEVPLADVLACADCIVSFRSKGGFSTVLPGFAGSVQVKGVVEIQVK